MPHRLTFPSPRRHWTPTGSGWSSRPYTKEDVLLTVQSGGWFTPSGHDFQDRETAELAAKATAVMTLLLEV